MDKLSPRSPQEAPEATFSGAETLQQKRSAGYAHGGAGLLPASVRLKVSVVSGARGAESNPEVNPSRHDHKVSVNNPIQHLGLSSSPDGKLPAAD